MKLNTQFVGFEAFSNHHEFLSNESSVYIEKFESGREFNCSVVVKQLSHKHAYLAEKYECEIRLFGSILKKAFIFKKSASDFYGAIRLSMRAAEKALRRESKLRLSRKRKLFAKINRKLNYTLEIAS